MNEARDRAGRLGPASVLAAALARAAGGPFAAAAAVAGVLTAGVLLGGVAVAGFALRLAGGDAGEAAFATAGPTVERLEAMGTVVSSRVVVTDVLTGTGEGYRACWLVRGDALLTCDLRGASVVARDDAAKTATILVPGIRVLSPRVDHAATKTWDFRKLSWMPWTWGDRDAVQDAAMHHAQKLVERAAGGEEYRQAARDQAELVLKKSFALVGWDVSVSWRE